MNHPETPQIDGEAAFQPTSAQQRVAARYCAPPWPSFNESARLESISINTAQAWRKRSDAFTAWIESERSEAMTEYLATLDGRLTGLGDRALDAIEEALASDDARVQVQAARWLLEQIRGRALERHTIAGADGGAAVFTIQIDHPEDAA